MDEPTSIQAPRHCRICGHTHNRREKCPPTCQGCGNTLDRIREDCPVCLDAIEYLYGA